MSDPGSADLSADVDFFALKEAMKRYPGLLFVFAMAAF